MRSKTVATSNDKGSTQAKRKQAVQSPPKKRQRISVVVAADRHSSEESIEKKAMKRLLTWPLLMALNKIPTTRFPQMNR